MDNLLIGAFIVFLLFCAGIIGWMFIMIGKGGDERRKMILQRTAANTFYVCIGLYLVDIITNIYTSFSEGYAEIQSVLIHSLSRLIVLAVLFVIQMIYYNRKFSV